MEAATTMMPDPPMPNMGSPRVRAAMKVMGLTLADLEKKALEAFGGMESTHLLFEKKRRVLVHQVHHLATKGPQGSTETDFAAPHGGTERNATFMDEVLRKERASFEVMQRMAKKDVQMTVIKELEGKLQVHLSAKKMEESVSRQKELKKELNEKLSLAKKEAAKKLEKSIEARVKAARQKEQRSEQLRKELGEADERVAKVLDTIAHSRDDEIEQNRVKFMEMAEKQAQYKEGKFQELLALHDTIEQRDVRKAELLETLASRHSNKEEIARKQQLTKQKVHDWQIEKQEHIDQKYREAVDRQEQALQVRETNLTARLKEFKKTNNQKRAAFDTRYEKVLKEREKPHSSQRLQRSASETLVSPKERQELLHAREEATNHVALAASNRERLQRAHGHAVEQQISKLQNMRDRTQVMLDARTEADRRRMMVLRNCAIEKHHLSQKVDRVKDSGAEKMLKLLGDMDVDHDAAVRINEILGDLGLPPLGGVVPEEDK
ncbi:unnamed protein product [Polarella glacialis]|uniref:Uncharacterized protein n=1 Tax=Polarella glacialis TaxID=89957 RepID=A0A813FLM3_POLGL|nr:unnamed protein product [Polarella glacialis]|mmetsp:Transcript_90486/g.163235  ORF Transcript_90486/g.163235 Transcript_90486/m.163235 type:complete len:493 (-) Transcript_90486:43-1521(-)|eukprot:CAMPEP_0115069564 /NCGR_PEP_ID=MMETSP0227-20121206/12633_1 /TAXON_ID=89957 /ORGANISM="Polarella glacialis, Strain CCMP 1383" /LENGTH=492 /DNA_ID=CAMNT_0002455991 /DNA_START=90 /DNA_END=1568 /DNA_ORIENTATION=-